MKGSEMAQDQSNVISQVFQRFSDSEEERLHMWTPLDDQLEALSWLDTDQLSREAQVVLDYHRTGKIKCNVVHTRTECFAPKIIDAVDAILSSYEQSGKVEKDSVYILQYYIALSQLNVISLEPQKQQP